MSDERIRQLPRSEVDSEALEEWIRETAEPDVRNVGAIKYAKSGEHSWSVAVWAAEFVRTEPLESLLRRRMDEALNAVSGVTGVVEEDREVWLVSGKPTGPELTSAAADVVDELADQIRDEIERL